LMRHQVVGTGLRVQRTWKPGSFSKLLVGFHFRFARHYFIVVLERQTWTAADNQNSESRRALVIVVKSRLFIHRVEEYNKIQTIMTLPFAASVNTK
jgi:hypothetical protein